MSRLDIRMSRLDKRMSRLDIRMSVPTMLVLINDPELLKQIQVKDFDHFVDRDHTFTNKIKKTQQRADTIWMEQLTSAQGWLFIFETFNRK